MTTTTPPPPERTGKASEGSGARRKPWSRPVIRCLSVLATESGGKRSFSLEVYEGHPDNPFPNYSPQSVEQAS